VNCSPICGLLERVSPHADAFVAEGLPARQLQNLADEIDRFAAAKSLQAKARQRFAAAADALGNALDTARKMIAALEVVAVDVSAAHPDVLTKLRLAMRVGPHARVAPASSLPGSRVPSAPAASPVPPTTLAAADKAA